MPEIKIEIDDREMRAALARLRARGSDLRPVLAQIGEALVDSTRQRFRQGSAPDGTPWAPNSPVTVLEYVRRRLGATVRRRGEKIRTGGARAARTAAGKRPLVGESRRLSTEIRYEVSPGQVAVGSSLVYAAVQQFGARKGQFGRTRRGAPIPWGDIPPRPFVGISADDRRTILELIEAHIDPGT